MCSFLLNWYEWNLKLVIIALAVVFITRVQSLASAGILFLLLCQDWHWDALSCLPVGAWGEQLEHKIDHSCPSSTEIKNEWTVTFAFHMHMYKQNFINFVPGLHL